MTSNTRSTYSTYENLEFSAIEIYDEIRDNPDVLQEYEAQRIWESFDLNSFEEFLTLAKESNRKHWEWRAYLLKTSWEEFKLTGRPNCDWPY